MNLLAAWIADAAALAPQATALIAGGEAFSFSALAERSAIVPTLLRGKAVSAAPAARDAERPRRHSHGDRGNDAVTLAFSAYACSFQGVPFAPRNPALPQQNWAASSPIELIISTSGSSGEPKGVMLSGENLMAAVAASQQRLPLREGDVWLDCLPLYHIGGMSILYRCAAARATVLLHEGFDAQRVWHDLAARRVTHISLVPAMLARLLDLAHGAPPPDTLKYALIGGGALAARARASGWPLCASYGMSETASQLATLFPLPEDWTPGCVGMPLPGFEVRIMAPDAGGAGVIQVRGAAVMAGYANPAQRLGEGLEHGWLTSGDLGRLDAGGQLYVLGRRDDVLVSGGVNVQPLEVEAQLLRFPGVCDVALTALPDEVWGDRLVALVVGEVELESLATWCREHLASAWRPRLMRRVTALPRNALGKLERVKLKNMVRELIDAESMGDAT